MARRTSNISKRISAIRGLPTVEKELLERIGTLVDAQINNRAPANPHAEGRRRAQKRLPPPKVIETEPGIRTSKISWDPVDSSIFSHYELFITNMDDGSSETLRTYTNVFFYKGKEGGNYKVTVCSVGRNGTKSPIVAEKAFTIPDNVMLLEGSKNSYQTAAVEVAEDIQFNEGNKIFAWAAFTIDSLIFSGNPTPSVQLWLASGEDQSFGNATLIEEIPLYSASESATCLDNTTLGGISRPALQPPASTDFNFVRGTTYETAFSTSFSPIDVDADYPNLVGTFATFYLRVTGREAEDDITGLSLSVWSVPAGQGDEIPAITLNTEPPFVYPWNTCVSLNADRPEGSAASPNNPGANHWYHSPALAGIGENIGRKRINREWTFGIWIKFERLIFTTGNTGAYFVEKFESLPTADFPGSGGLGYNNTAPLVSLGIPVNGFAIDCGRQEPTPVVGRTFFGVHLGGRENPSLLNGNSERTQFWRWIDSYSNIDDDEFSDPIYTASDPTEPIMASGLNTWMLIMLSYNDADGMTLWVDGIRKRAGILSGSATNPIYNRGRGHMAHTIGSRSSFILYPDLVFNGSWTGPPANPNSTWQTTNPCPCLIYAAGLWNTSTPKFTDGVAAELFANPQVNWREPIPGGLYQMSGNLVHYWQMSAQLQDYDEWVARDTGWYIGASGGFTGRANASMTGYHPRTFQMPESTIVVADHP